MSEAPRVEILIEGQPWDLWTNVEIVLSLEELAPRFTFEAFDIREGEDELFPFDEGDVCEIRVLLPGQLQAETVVTGYLERPEISDGPDDGDRRMTVTGGPSTVDLVQSHAPPQRWNDAQLLKIAADLCDPFGVLVSSKVTLTEPVKRFEVDPGDTPASALQRLCESYGVIATATPDGNVELVRATEAKSGISLRCPGNIVRGTATGDFTDRFSHYTVFSQSTPTKKFAEKLAAGQVVQVQDDQVRRFRPFYTVEDRDESKAPLEARARHLRNLHAGRSRVYGCEVDGWDNGLGQVWRPNTLCDVEHKRVGVDDELLIARVVLTGGAQEPGYIAHIDLAPRETFDMLLPPPPIPKMRRKRHAKKNIDQTLINLTFPFARL